MKKAILSSLCSGFVIPGLGQILNHEVKKGVLLLSAVFVLFIGGCIKLAFMIASMMASAPTKGGDSQELLQALEAESLGSLWILVVLFAMIWVYSVIDAFLTGRKLEGQKPREILSD